jgi:hypothetical protein
MVNFPDLKKMVNFLFLDFLNPVFPAYLTFFRYHVAMLTWQDDGSLVSTSRYKKDVISLLFFTVDIAGYLPF